MKKFNLLAPVAAILLFVSCEKTVEILIDASRVENTITPWLYGSCIEDVNHEIYGGLYDQRIFGESFEEPAGSPDIADFSRYDGFWRVDGGVLSVASSPGAKLVYDGLEIVDGLVEVDMRFDGAGVNGGILVRVSDAGTGADNFNGYEINVTADGKMATLGKHRMDWKFLTETAVDIDPAAWNRLGVRMQGSRITIMLNGKTVIDYDDTDEPLLSGKAAIRIWNADSSYKNFAAETDGVRHEIPFNAVPAPQVSAMWDAIVTGNAEAGFAHDGATSYNSGYSQVIEMTGGAGTVGVANMSLNRWGIAVRENQRFEGSVYLKTSGLSGKAYVALQSADGSGQYAVKEIANAGKEWAEYSFELTSSATDPKARFTIYIDAPGKLWIDQATLMSTGEDQFHNLPLRADIGQAMVDQGLTFLRYGGSMVNVPDYKWKNMVGGRDKRPVYRGNWYTYSTNGFGIEEFLMYAEAAGFVPSFAVSVLESAEDMAGMIEYLNGPADSPWGRKRAEAGHPEPYNVKYIQIGNEEVIHGEGSREGYVRYIEQFNRIYDAIHAKDPNVVFINAAWWRPNSLENMKMVFHALDGKAAYWDYHPWADDLTDGKKVDKELQEMKDLFRKWNPSTTMKCALFEENGVTHNMQRALAHATVQNAARRHGDFLLTTCSANALQPYGQNDNGWDQGQVFFTPAQVWGMPPYYAQQMASRHHKPLKIYSETDEMLDVVATADETGREIVLHVVNVHDSSIKSSVDIARMTATLVKSVTMTAELSAVNTPEEPEKIVPIERRHSKKGKITHTFPPYSYTILVLQVQ